MKSKFFKPAVVTIAVMFMCMILTMVGCAKSDIKSLTSDDGRVTMYVGRSYDPMGIDAKSLIFSENGVAQQVTVQQPAANNQPAVWQPGPNTVPAFGENGLQPICQPVYHQQQIVEQPQQQRFIAQPQRPELKIIATNHGTSDGWAKPIPAAAVNGAFGMAGMCLGKTRVNISCGNSAAGASSASSSSSGAGATIIGR